MGVEPLKFHEMYNLLGERILAEPSPLIGPSRYNQELFIAIFWEESFFRNMRQDSGWDSGRSVGFGQVQWIFVNKMLGTNFKDQIGAITSDNKLSVDLALKAMLEFDRMAKGNKTAALKSYAGGKTPPWTQTSDALQKIPAIAASYTLTAAQVTSDQAAIQAALALTRNDATMFAKIF